MSEHPNRDGAGAFSRPAAIHHVTDAASGLDAWLVLHDVTLGPAFGGIRFCAYPDADAAREDALGLARQMAWKCALAGLPAGGGKVVVHADRLIDRPAACAALGEFIQELGGQFRTAGDLGATADDVRAIQARTGYIVDASRLEGLADAVAAGLVAAMDALAERLESDLASCSVLVQGAGSIGGSLLRRLVGRGVRPQVADPDPAALARALEFPGTVEVAPDQALHQEVAILAPCAVGGVIDLQAAERLRCQAVAGGANRILAEPAAGQRLWKRRIWYAPDFLVNAGAVIEGVFQALRGRPAGEREVARIGERLEALLVEALERDLPPEQVAMERAERLILEARKAR